MAGPTVHWSYPLKTTAPPKSIDGDTVSSGRSSRSRSSTQTTLVDPATYFDVSSKSIERSKILPGDSLTVYEHLASESGKYFAYLSDSGILTIRNHAADIKHHVAPSRRSNTTAKSLELRKDGNLVMLDANKKLIWSSRSASKESERKQDLKLVLENSGYLVLFSGSEPIWASGKDFWRTWTQV